MKANIDLQNVNYLRTQAADTIYRNLAHHSGKKYLAAGSNQFYTLWVRDFCYSVPGLLSVKEIELVETQLRLILEFTKADGLLPRGIDVINPKTRVLLNTVLRWLPEHLKRPGYEGKTLTPEYKGEHGTRAFDSLLLVPWAVLKLVEYFRRHKSDRGEKFLQDVQPQLELCLKSLQNSLQNGLFYQEPYSDWQDSTKREGHQFTSHVLFLRLKKLANNLELNWFNSPIWPTEEKIFNAFFDSAAGLFSNLPRGTAFPVKQYPLEANLWVIQDGIFGEGRSLYEILKQSPLWNLRGVPVYPQSPSSEVAWTTKFVGLRHYHDNIIWSWLLAEMFKASFVMDDFKAAGRILEEMSQCSKDYFGIFEVYVRHPHLQPLKTLLYKSEVPFSWGACKWLEALALISENPTV